MCFNSFLIRVIKIVLGEKRSNEVLYSRRRNVLNEFYLILNFKYF